MIRTWLLFAAAGTAYAAGGAEMAISNGHPMLTGLLSLFLLCCSAFFSSSETALFSLQVLQLEELAANKNTAIQELIEQPRQTLASVLIGNETANIALSTLTASFLLQEFPDYPWLNIVIVAPVLLMFGEVVPKTIAFRFNLPIARRVAPILRVFAQTITPIRFALSRLADAALVLTGGTRAPRQAALREAHLRALIERGRRLGTLRPVEQEILDKVFSFGEHTVHRLMTPRPDVFSVNLLTPWSELLDTVLRSGHSRIPVWQGSPDNIVGILVVKKLLTLIAAERSHTMSVSSRRTPYRPSPRQIHKLLHAPRFVPTTKQADDLLSEFQARRSHMAIVVDEHGSVVGVITLDDLLNELVGEMYDETDSEDPAVTRINSHTYRVRATMSIDDFANRFHVSVPSGDYTTLGGFVLSLAGELPEKGDQFDWNGMRHIISGLVGNRITEVTLLVEHASAEEEPTQEAPISAVADEEHP